MTEINKETLEYLANLGKLRLEKGQEEKLLADLKKILAHFEELKEVDTTDVEPLSGGTTEENVWRSDNPKKSKPPLAERENLIRAFPEKLGDFLKVPPVFE